MFKTPLEIITDLLIPTLRVLEAKRLRSMGMSQSKIATLLGVTQPAIKQYLDANEEEYLNKLEKLGFTRHEIDSLLETLTEIVLKGDIKSVMYYLTTFSISNLSSLKFCEFHRHIDNSIPLDCDICRGIYREDEEELMNLALLMLENRIVTPLIPEVLSNLAFSKRNPKDERDVIAVPGRITKIFGVPKPASKPAWGGSRHLASILLQVNKISPTTRAVMNIKFDSKIEKILYDLNFKVIKVGPISANDEENIARSVYSVFQDGTDAIIHLGGVGLEPNTYVFGKDPVDVVKKVLEIAKRYS